ncbi:MAG: dTMP kinase [Parvularculaceae bacterium]|nr:MAG: dTMP kinase [Parvularculaceae bacterium]
MTARAPFIVFEGGDGAGKSTQISLLADALTARGIAVLTTREPGGAPGAERLRELLVTGAVDDWSPVSEALLMYAARAEHLAKTINPARAAGTIVLCDRFSDSTAAYQGAAGRVDPVFLAALEAHVVGGDAPDLVMILDVAPETGLSRAQDRHSGEDRFEQKGRDFQSRVREAFVALANADPQRKQLINANRQIADVSADILQRVIPLVQSWQNQSG